VGKKIILILNKNKMIKEILIKEITSLLEKKISSKDCGYFELNLQFHIEDHKENNIRVISAEIKPFPVFAKN